jgi:hypothetical protein
MMTRYLHYQLSRKTPTTNQTPKNMTDPHDYEYDYESDDDRMDREDASSEAEGSGYYRDMPIRNEEGEIIDTNGWGV